MDPFLRMGSCMEQRHGRRAAPVRTLTEHTYGLMDAARVSAMTGIPRETLRSYLHRNQAGTGSAYKIPAPLPPEFWLGGSATWDAETVRKFVAERSQLRGENTGEPHTLG